MNTATDWYVWSQPVAEGGLGKGTFVGDATRGYSRLMEDLAAGQEPRRRQLPVLDRVGADRAGQGSDRRGRDRALPERSSRRMRRDGHPPGGHAAPLLEPGVGRRSARRGVHRRARATTNLCGFGSAGGAMIVEEMGEHAALIGAAVRRPRRRLGHAQRADELPARGLRHRLLSARQGRRSSSTCRRSSPRSATTSPAHAAMYHAIKANDTIDADGDGDRRVGRAVDVGRATGQPSRAQRDRRPNPADLAARDADHLPDPLRVRRLDRQRHVRRRPRRHARRAAPRLGGHDRLARPAVLLPRRRVGRPAAAARAGRADAVHRRLRHRRVPARARSHLLRADAWATRPGPTASSEVLRASRRALPHAAARRHRGRHRDRDRRAPRRERRARARVDRARRATRASTSAATTTGA